MRSPTTAPRASAATSPTSTPTRLASTGVSSSPATATSSCTSAATWTPGCPSRSCGHGAGSTPKPRPPTRIPPSPSASARASPIRGCSGRGPPKSGLVLHAAVVARRRRVVLLVADPALGDEAGAVELLHENTRFEGGRGGAALADALLIVAVEVLRRRAGLGPIVPDAAAQPSRERDDDDGRAQRVPCPWTHHAEPSSCRVLEAM